MADRKGIMVSLIPTLEKRGKRLKQIEQSKNKPQSGGMFDFIYKKKKEREKAIADIDL